jgi:hypothetical protein
LEVDVRDQDVASIALSSDNNYLVMAGRKEPQVVIWGLEQNERIARLDTQGTVRDVRFSPNGKWLVAATTQGVRAWRTFGIDPHPEVVEWIKPAIEIIYKKEQGPLLSFERSTTVGVVRFSASAELEETAAAATNKLKDHLARTENVRVADQENLDRVLEIFARNLKILTESQRKELRLANVEKLLTGELRRPTPTSLSFSVSLIDVATALTDGVRTVECLGCSPKDWHQVVEALATVVVKQKDPTHQDPSIDPRREPRLSREAAWGCGFSGRRRARG